MFLNKAYSQKGVSYRQLLLGNKDIENLKDIS